MDRLDALLRRFAVTAQMFHSGPLCGIHDFAAEPGAGQLHLIRAGRVRVEHARRRTTIVEPSLVFYPRPFAHRFVTDTERGADMACANVRFDAGAGDPLAQALPSCVVMPLAALDDAGALLDVLFREAFARRCGRQAVVDRLFEVVLIHVLRRLMQQGEVAGGLLAGLAHPRIAKSLCAVHAAPARDWTLERLAGSAGMSRSSFAATFRATVGTTPGDYVAGFRLYVAQDLLRQGRSLKQIAAAVGYGSPAALSRAFRAGCGVSPRTWRSANAPPV